MEEETWSPGQPVPACGEDVLEVEEMDGTQRAFYAWLTAEIASGRAPDVGGFSSYPFAYAHAAVFEFKGGRDYRRLVSAFDLLLANYSETFLPREVSKINHWRFEAAVLCRLWDEAWAHRSGEMTIINLTRTVSVRLGFSPRLTAADLGAVVFGRPRITEYGLNNRAAIDEAVQVLLDQLHDTAGCNLVDLYCDKIHHEEDCPDATELSELIEDFDYRNDASEARQANKRQIALTQTRTMLERTGAAPFVTESYYFDAEGVEFDTEDEWLRAADELHSRRVEDTSPPADDRLLSITMVGTFVGGNGTRRVLLPGYSREDRTVAVEGCSRLAGTVIQSQANAIFRDAENQVRVAQGLLRVGEGWFSETQLYTQIRASLTGIYVQQHARPKWLAPQHFDVYLPRHNIAIEFQGSQHFGPVAFFGGEATFAKQLERDARKRAASESNGCYLIEVRAGYNLASLIEEIQTVISARSDV